MAWWMTESASSFAQLTPNPATTATTTSARITFMPLNLSRMDSRRG